MAVQPPTALAELRAGVGVVGGRVVAESGRSLTARFGSNLAWRSFGPVWPAGRRRSPAVVTLAIDPEPGGSLITAQAQIGVNNFFNAKITSDLYNDRLSSLLAALESSFRRLEIDSPRTSAGAATEPLTARLSASPSAARRAVALARQDDGGNAERNPQDP